MNPETALLIERPYQEIVDDILTAIVGGVVNEPIIFDLKEDFYPLSQPAADVRSITGTRAGQHVAFWRRTDYEFDRTANAVIWQAKGGTPDDETIFYVDYFQPGSRSPLNDINVGSVTRTLTEAIGREIATVYQQINQAYLAGYLETATGQSLDLVVAILGIQRKTKEYASGLVTFFRDPAAQGSVTIAENMLLTSEKGIAFVTSELRTLQRGQVRIDVPVRAGDEFKGEAGLVAANAITSLAQPIAGIARVTNLEPTVLGAEDETDVQLRARAVAVLRGLGKATLAALAQAIARERAQLLEVWDPAGPPGKTADPGTVTLLVAAEPERFASVDAAVQETRAAGVLATVVAHYVFFRPRLVAKLARSLAPAGKLKLLDEIIAALQKVVDPLGAGAPIRGQDLLKTLKEIKDIAEPRFVDVMAWRADVGQPGASSLVDSLFDAASANRAADAATLRVALAEVLAAASQAAPAAQRVPDRGLVQRDGRRATDADIEAGQFQVSVPGADWWVALDMKPADIFLVSAEKS